MNAVPTADDASPAVSKEQLAELNERKERAFLRKQEVGTKIAEKIRQIGEFRKARNDLTRQVREMKVQRDALNTQITERITQIKEMRPAEKPVVPRPQLTDAKGRPVRVRDLQRQVKILEEKMETVPMDFQAEQKMMKTIKALKKQIDQFDQAEGLSGDLAVKSREIDDLKKQANVLHAKVTKIAKDSQEYHERMIKLSAEIEELKKEEEGIYQEFLQHKQEYVKIAGEVRGAETEARQVRNAQREEERKARKEKDAQDQKTLQQRAKEAEEKMLKGEKLTTEDLLALQSMRD